MSAGKRMGQAWRSWREKVGRKTNKSPRGKMSKLARRMIRAGMRAEIRAQRIKANKGHGFTPGSTRWDARRSNWRKAHHVPFTLKINKPRMSGPTVAG